jgi:hypothetical protein
MIIQMKKYTLVSLLLLFYLPSFAQNKYDYVWHTGYRFFRGSPSNLWFGFQLNFNNGKVKIDTMKRNYDFQETIVSSCDSSGNFLFSSNGCKIFNKKFEVMENGDDLNQVPASTFSNACIVTSAQAEIIRNGALSLPIPNSKDSLFAFFRTETNQVITAQQNLLPLNLYYSEINMKSNNGLGKVVVKNKIIVKDTLDGGDINAAKHANSKDWWVITRKFASNIFFTFRLSKNGLDTFFTQIVGEPTELRGQYGGDAFFSPNGLKYAYFTARDQLMLYDFDRTTGKLFSFKRIIIPFESSVGDVIFTGVAFAPNSKLLYVFTSKQIFQVDTDVSDIQGSLLQVSRHDPIAAPYAFPTAGRLAPDCKIYFISTNGSQLIGYIRYPDRKGIACQVVQGGIRLPYSVAIVGGLPNNPNYRLGVIPTYPCDSTIDFRVSNKEMYSKVNVNIFPNPSTGNVTLDWDEGINTEGGVVRVFNVLGQMIFQQKIPAIDTRTQLDLNVPSGVYQINMNFKEHKVFQGKVLIVK